MWFDWNHLILSNCLLHTWFFTGYCEEYKDKAWTFLSKDLMLGIDCPFNDVILLSEYPIKLYFSVFKERKVCLVHFYHGSIKLWSQI